jgi:hypothetical protein
MPETNFRALCAELVELSAPTDSISQLTERIQNLAELAKRARAALAQPEPEGVTDEELPPRVGHILRLAEIIREVDGAHDKGAAALAESILSHPGSRWRPAIEPVSQQEVK